MSLTLDIPLNGFRSVQFRHSAPFRPFRKGEVVTLLVHNLSSPKVYDDKIQMNGKNNPFEYVRWDRERKTTLGVWEERNRRTGAVLNS